MWIVPIISTLCTLLTVSANNNGTLDVDIFSSKDIELNLKFGVNEFPVVVRQQGSRHFSFHPSSTSTNEYFPMTVGLANSNESPIDVKFRLVPGIAEELLEFDKVTITIKANYTLNIECENMEEESELFTNICRILIIAIYLLILLKIGTVLHRFFSRRQELRMVDEKENNEKEIDHKNADDKKKKIFPDPPAYSDIDKMPSFPEEKTIFTVDKVSLV